MVARGWEDESEEAMVEKWQHKKLVEKTLTFLRRIF